MPAKVLKFKALPKHKCEPRTRLWGGRVGHINGCIQCAQRAARKAEFLIASRARGHQRRMFT